VITSGGERFVIPQVSLLELIRLEGEAARKQIEWIHGTPVYRRRGSLLPIAYLNRVLGLKDGRSARRSTSWCLQAEDRQFGLVVDAISDTQEIVVKPLGKQLKG
jgi:two-component system chemotaxis sensor kinase CheA